MVVTLSLCFSCTTSRSFPLETAGGESEDDLRKEMNRILAAEIVMNETKEKISSAERSLDKLEVLSEGWNSLDHGGQNRVERRSKGMMKDHVCDVVCGHCMGVASRRVASLCSSECLWEGHHFKACLTYYTLLAN